jgi:hypothetical protein
MQRSSTRPRLETAGHRAAPRSSPAGPRVQPSRATPLSDGVAGSVDPYAEAILRAGVALGLAAVALIHFLDVFSKFKETPYLGVGYIGLIIAALAVGGRLIRGGGQRLWLMAGALAIAAVGAYVLSRAVGLPQASGDIGNWQEPLGLAALFVEGLVAALSIYALALFRPAEAPPSAAEPEV